jgi:hypothetical protein
MQFDLDSMAAIDRYELLLRTVVPRPIALVTTMSNDGMVNATPYSLFNVVGHDPAVAIRCTSSSDADLSRYCQRIVDLESPTLPRIRLPRLARPPDSTLGAWLLLQSTG